MTFGDSGGPVAGTQQPAVGKAIGVLSSMNSNGTRAWFSQASSMQSIFGGGAAT